MQRPLLVYLACPYSNPASAREWRCMAVTAAAAKLKARGCGVLSPITHCHPVNETASTMPVRDLEAA